VEGVPAKHGEIRAVSAGADKLHSESRQLGGSFGAPGILLFFVHGDDNFIRKHLPNSLLQGLVSLQYRSVDANRLDLLHAKSQQKSLRQTSCRWEGQEDSDQRYAESGGPNRAPALSKQPPEPTGFGLIAVSGS